MTSRLLPAPSARALCSIASIAFAAIVSTSSPIDAQSQGGSGTGTPPNILLIQMDDVGIDRLQTYGLGQNLTPTPTIDQIAAAGVKFTNAWAHSLCSPSRAALMTGRHAFRTGVGHLMPGPDLALSETTIPEFLDATQSGYSHAAIGKWHLSRFDRGPEIPRQHGFSHFAGYLGLVDYFNWPRIVDGVQSVSSAYAMTQHVDDAIAWTSQQTSPWFCYLSITSVHIPYHEPPAHLHTQNLTGLDPNIDPEPFLEAMIEAMDNELGRMLVSLGPELANTVIILTSDNGTAGDVIAPPVPSFGGGKGSIRETGVRVPLIISGPGIQTPGRTVTSPVELVDLFATIADIAGLAVGPGVAEDSESLWPFATNPSHAAIDPISYSELFTDDPARSLTNVKMARTERYKLARVRTVTGALGEQFFDLQNDPFEANDLFNGTLTPAEQQAYDLLRTRIDSYTGLGNGFTQFGSASCATSVGPLSFRAVGSPTLGNEYGLLVRNLLPALPAAVYMGISNSAFGPLPLPLDLQLLGAGAGCELLQSMNIELLTQSDAFGRIGLWIPVPNDNALIGTSLYHQVVVLDPLIQGVAFPIAVTPGIETTFSR